MRDKVNPGATIFTDEWVSYKALSKEYKHSIVNHSIEQYVDGDVHTKNIKSFWALLKRGIFGIYHHVSDDHLNNYINQFSFRLNTRKLRFLVLIFF